MTSVGHGLDEEGRRVQGWGHVKVLPREVPSLYGSFPVSLHPELKGFVPAADLEKARNQAGRERAAAAPRSSAFCLQQWRWALSVSLSHTLEDALYIVAFHPSTSQLLGSLVRAQQCYRSHTELWSSKHIAPQETSCLLRQQACDSLDAYGDLQSLLELRQQS